MVAHGPEYAGSTLALGASRPSSILGGPTERNEEGRECEAFARELKGGAMGEPCEPGEPGSRALNEMRVHGAFRLVTRDQFSAARLKEKKWGETTLPISPARVCGGKRRTERDGASTSRFLSTKRRRTPFCRIRERGFEMGFRAKQQLTLTRAEASAARNLR